MTQATTPKPSCDGLASGTPLRVRRDASAAARKAPVNDERLTVLIVSAGPAIHVLHEVVAA